MPGLSNWREDFNLAEVVTGKMTDTKALQKVSEKSNINNKVTINPKLDEAVKEIGGEVISMVEADTKAQHQRLDMKQMILDRQKLKLRRKDMSQAKQEKKNDVEGDSSNAMKQSNVVQSEAVKGEDREMRKMAAQDRAAGIDKRLSPKEGKRSVKPVYYSKRYTKEEVVNVKKENEKKRKNALQIQKVIGEADLNAAERRALPDKDFALPGKGKGPEGKQAGSYPIPDEKHARSALSLVAQHGTPEEKATVRAKVKKKFPNIEVNEGVMKMVKRVMAKKKPEKKAEKAMDAGAKARRAMKRREHAKYVSGSTENVPDDLREGKDKAFDFVVKQLQKKHGKDAVVTKDNPIKPPTEAQKKAAAAHRAKLAKQDRRDPTEIASSGRYSDRYSNRGSD